MFVPGVERRYDTGKESRGEGLVRGDFDGRRSSAVRAARAEVIDHLQDRRRQIREALAARGEHGRPAAWPDHRDAHGQREREAR